MEKIPQPNVETVTQLCKQSTAHKVAAHLIAIADRTFSLWQGRCAAYLAVGSGISLGDAKAIIAEMHVN